MQVIKELDLLHQIINNQKESGKTIGFVPTMGALHNGHLSLVKEAQKSCDFIVMSIFVNPTQFNDTSDLEKYPRTLGADVKLLESTACNLVFAPEVETMYPEADERVFDFGSLATVMEGAFRPGHFNGVGQVVSKLFLMVKPHKAFFGQKDFQQFAIIKHMTKLLNLPVEVISCPIIREESGLAMSSRNQLLSAQEKEKATAIYQTLAWAKLQNNSKSIAELKDAVSSKINAIDCLDVEYVEIADADSLQSLTDWNAATGIALCVAVYCGKVRLIDNVLLK
ncbi:MAG: pantoate--beta-alanine ligase [Mangrovibacterium sp.]